jgi:hypothetical protein
MVVVVGAKDKHGGGRVKPTHPTDGPNQLGHRVLGGDRVVQQRGVQRPPLPPSQDPSLSDHHPDRLEDPLGPVGGPKPAAPQGQHRGVKALIGQAQPAGDLQAMFWRSCAAASRSDNPSNACNTMTVAT